MSAISTDSVRENRGVNPPLLTGGLIHHAKSLSRAVDYITATVGTEQSKALIVDTDHDEPGHAGRGFGKSERRACLGGKLWRRWEPLQPSEAWGMEYESWDVDGVGASWMADRLRDVPCRPSRVDVAWDFEVPASFTPDKFIDIVAKHVAEVARTTVGISGQGGRNTRYVGAPSSLRRVRVYRKDWETPGFAEMWGPVLRVELILKAEHAVAWWAPWVHDREEGFEVAAGHVAQMCGVRVQEQLQPVPELVQPEGADEAAALFQFAKQHGPQLNAWFRAGVDVASICRAAADRSSRMTKHRMGKRVKAITAAGVPCVVAQVMQMLTVKPA